MKTRGRLLALGCVCLCLATVGCGTIDVHVAKPYEGGRLPRPRAILVYDFETADTEFAMENVDGNRWQAAGTVSKALSLALVSELEDLGIPAERRTREFEVPTDSFAIHGQLTQLDEGRAWKRVLIGFGYGRSRVGTTARLYRHVGGGPEALVEYDATATSGRVPGVITTLPIGIVYQGVAFAVSRLGGGESVGEFSRALRQDAERTAHAWAEELEELFEQHGWFD